jgi:antitoxin MazE
MNIQVGKWGNSLGVRIPLAMAKELGLHDGSEIDLQQVSGSLILRPVVKEEIAYSLDEMLAKMTPETIHTETDWGAAQGNEEW